MRFSLLRARLRPRCATRAQRPAQQCAIVVVAMLIASTSSWAQAPCLEPLPNGLLLPKPDAADVPTNVTPIVSFVNAHLEVDGVTVPARVETLQISHEPSFVLFQRHIPDEDFEIGQRVDVVAPRGGIVGSFTIAVEDDDVPPA
jgi:hypothetical protein